MKLKFLGGWYIIKVFADKLMKHLKVVVVHVISFYFDINSFNNAKLHISGTSGEK